MKRMILMTVLVGGLAAPALASPTASAAPAGPPVTFTLFTDSALFGSFNGLIYTDSAVTLIGGQVSRPLVGWFLRDEPTDAYVISYDAAGTRLMRYELEQARPAEYFAD